MSALQRRIKRGWMNLRVSAIQEDTHDTKTFIMEDADEGGCAFDYDAGQYLTFRFDNIEAKPLVRSYTMSSSPCQKDFIAVTVKRVYNGLISNWFCDQVKVGDVLRARGPIGKFCFLPDKHTPHLVMVGAGSGVTPFVSIIREYQNRLGEPRCPKLLSLLVAYRSKEDLICWPVLEEAKKIPGVRIYTTLTREERQNEGFLHGRPGPEMLDELFRDDFAHATFMTCGPEEMMNMVVEHCKARGTPEERIALESFY